MKGPINDIRHHERDPGVVRLGTDTGIVVYRTDREAHAPVRHAEGLQGGQGGGVVGLVLDLGHQLAVQHLLRDRKSVV